ncbi:MAG: hypothetical protein U0271_09665 [Polyangiaceae bacterium]
MSFQKRGPARIQDRALRDAASRLESFSTMLANRVEEVVNGADRTEKTLAALEAEVAARLVESAVYEVALRLVPHGIEFEPERQLRRRLGRYHFALAQLEAAYGPLLRA